MGRCERRERVCRSIELRPSVAFAIAAVTGGAPRYRIARERRRARGRSSTPVPAASGGGPWLVWLARRLRHLHEKKRRRFGEQARALPSRTRSARRPLCRDERLPLPRERERVERDCEGTVGMGRCERRVRSRRRVDAPPICCLRDRGGHGALLATASRANGGAHAGARRPPRPPLLGSVAGLVSAAPSGTSTAEAAAPLRRAGEGSALAHPVCSAAPSRDERLPLPRERERVGERDCEGTVGMGRCERRGALSKAGSTRIGAPPICCLRDRGGHGGRSSLPHRARTAARARALVPPVPAASGGGPWLVWLARRLRHLRYRSGCAASASRRGALPSHPVCSAAPSATRDSLSRGSGRGVERDCEGTVGMGRCERRVRSRRQGRRGSSSAHLLPSRSRRSRGALLATASRANGGAHAGARRPHARRFWGGPWLVWFARRLRHLHSRSGCAASEGRGLRPRAPGLLGGSVSRRETPSPAGAGEG